ncbi:MAG: hypothetical protein J7647_06230 [Cyanobacteria bacterium SBLK]|nr:hypothetical protein [Cyanobacteria bacterium SBLK]
MRKFSDFAESGGNLERSPFSFFLLDGQTNDAIALLPIIEGKAIAVERG